MDNSTEKMLFCCPKCKGALTELEGRAVCPLGHSYDKSKYSYYNLLLGSCGGTHGDNREMILARRAFLLGGYYFPLAERISALALKYTSCGGRLLDVGCGEGYYTDIIENALYERDNFTRVAAFDISKDAVKEAARKNKRVSFCVGSAYSTPAADGSFDTVVNAFSPYAGAELLRILSPGGVFIMAIPEQDHLYELKEILYDNPYKNEVKDSHLDGLELIEDERIKYKMVLEGECIGSLFKMTPYAYRTPKDRAEKLQRVSKLSVTADFHLFAYRKTN